MIFNFFSTHPTLNGESKRAREFFFICIKNYSPEKKVVVEWKNRFYESVKFYVIFTQTSSSSAPRLKALIILMCEEESFVLF
jgi:hypothetical protein